MKITTIKRTIKNTKRLAEIVKVLSKFGFRQLIHDSGLYRLLGAVREEPDIDQAVRLENLTGPERVRLVLEDLGPTFIKFGQILSTRPDLIPQEWATEFKKLQDDCKQVPFADIYQVLLSEFPGRLDLLFTDIEEAPLAAASIAQVHRATMKDGSEVVVKVIRPGAREIIEEDMALVETLAQILDQYFSNLGYSPTAVAKEFSREMLKEINLVIEGQSTERLRRYFEDDENISFPRVHWPATTRNVLTLQEIRGRLLSTVTPSDLSPHERRTIVAHATDAVFKQCLRFGFFHADPHPGNIFLLPGCKLCFIDCGLTGQLDRKTTDELINLVAGVVKGDIDRLCRVVLELTDADPLILDNREFRLELRHLTDRFRNTDLGHLNIASLLSDFFGMLQRYRIQCPESMTLLTKALTTIEGVAADFDPTFDVIEHVEPLIQEVVVKRRSFRAIRRRFLHALANTVELLEDLPGDLQRFLDLARHRRFTLNLELKRIEHLSEQLDTSSRLLGIAMIIAALIVGSAILILADRMAPSSGFIGTLGFFGLILAGISTTGFIVSFLLPRKRK